MASKLLSAICALLLTFVSAGASAAESFDIVIQNGRVMDPETGFDAVANVGINNGFITRITTDKIKGKRNIDASGHVVAPGFIKSEVQRVAPGVAIRNKIIE